MNGVRLILDEDASAFSAVACFVRHTVGRDLRFGREVERSVRSRSLEDHLQEIERCDAEAESSNENARNHSL